MSVKIYKSEYNIQNTNGDVKKKGYEIAVNPNDQNKVYLSLTNNNRNINVVDNLEHFLSNINNNKEDLFTSMEKDLKLISGLPIPLYPERLTQKKRVVLPKKKLSFKRPKKKPSKKKPKKSPK